LGFAGTTPQTKGFIGQRLDDKSGLMYLHARYYDPQLGRFIQADPSDPLGLGVGVNRYAYAGDNPVAYLDPTGLHHTNIHDFNTCDGTLDDYQRLIDQGFIGDVYQSERYREMWHAEVARQRQALVDSYNGDEDNIEVRTFDASVAAAEDFERQTAAGARGNL